MNKFGFHVALSLGLRGHRQDQSGSKTVQCAHIIQLIRVDAGIHDFKSKVILYLPMIPKVQGAVFDLSK